jgi:uncharacterized membrane-anchored protein YhcB (DUF1043 family)
MMTRLAELDLIIKQAQLHLRETLELIDRMRAHYLQIQETLSDAEREHASLLAEAARCFAVSKVVPDSRAERQHGTSRP